MFHPNSPSNKGMVNALPLILKLLLRIDYWGTAEDALIILEFLLGATKLDLI